MISGGWFSFDVIENKYLSPKILKRNRVLTKKELMENYYLILAKKRGFFYKIIFNYLSIDLPTKKIIKMY